MRGHGDREGAVDPRQLLDRDRIGDRVEPRSARALGQGDAEQPQLRRRLHQLGRKPALAVELLCDRRQSPLCERAHRLAELRVLVGQVVAQRHWQSASASSTSSRTPNPLPPLPT